LHGYLSWEGRLEQAGRHGERHARAPLGPLVRLSSQHTIHHGGDSYAAGPDRRLRRKSPSSPLSGSGRMKGFDSRDFNAYDPSPPLPSESGTSRTGLRRQKQQHDRAGGGGGSGNDPAAAPLSYSPSLTRSWGKPAIQAAFQAVAARIPVHSLAVCIGRDACRTDRTHETTTRGTARRYGSP
jgi:hypothetical protein